MKWTVFIFIDNSIAENRAWRDALLLEVLQEGVLTSLIRWTHALVANRQYFGTFEGAMSKMTIQTQSAHQGSVQSPLLFLFCIDLHWGSGDLHVCLFADDVAIWALNSKLHIAERRLQQSLYAVTTWSKERNTLLSAQTSECSLFSMNSH